MLHNICPWPADTWKHKSFPETQTPSSNPYSYQELLDLQEGLKHLEKSPQNYENLGCKSGSARAWWPSTGQSDLSHVAQLSSAGGYLLTPPYSSLSELPGF